MDNQLLIVIGILFLLGLLFITIFQFRKRSSRDKRKASSILSSIQFTEEELDAAAEIKEIKSKRQRFYRISGFKWIICLLFTLTLLFMATFEFWFDYYPHPQAGEPYPITLRAAYAFTHGGVSYSPGTILLNRGKTATVMETERVTAYRSQKSWPSPLKVLGFFIQFLVLSLFFVFWLMLFLPESGDEENKNLVFIFLVILLVVAAAKLSYLTAIISPYYVPISAVAILVAILIANRLVPSSIIFTSFFVAIVTDFNIQLLVVLFTGGMVCVFWLSNVKKRSQVISTGIAVGVANLVSFLSLNLMLERDLLTSSLQEHAIAALANGLISAFLALLLIPIFEKLFSYLSPFRLMELSDLDSEILRELYLKAPGTYHHSLAVANLSEIAANAIGADALLLRVGSYYHDIGKMFKAKFFVENIDPHSENPHTKISPYASSKVLKSHITLGLELGEKYGLPRKILDLIPQHHGTTIMDYFYDKAKSSKDRSAISREYFSYPGPRPRTRESAILMIVDSVEAASRVLTDHSEETVLKMIERIINHKLEHGQLDETPMTVADLRKITHALTKALATSSHKRIDYPTNTGISADFNAANAAIPGNGAPTVIDGETSGSFPVKDLSPANRPPAP